MSELTIERSPVVIAAEINQIKDQTRKMVLHNTIEIGKRLVEAKEVVPHGEWGKWLEESFDYSQSTANNLMRIYKEYGSDQVALFGGTADSEAIANLTYTQAIALLDIPSYEREEFIEKNNVHELSTRELEKVIKEKKELEKKLKEAEEEAKKKEQLEKQIETYQKSTEILEKKLEDAETNNDKETIEKLSGELSESNKKIKQLEDELKRKPIEVPRIIEKVPEAVEKELEALRKQVENKTSDEAEAKFKYQFESLVDSFRSLIESLNAINNDEQKIKYQEAVKKLINKMNESL